MNIVLRFSLLLGALLTFTGTVHAVPFVLTPPRLAEPQVKVAALPSYDIVCDNRVSLECDLEPGRYQVQEFDIDWNANKRIILISPPGLVETVLPELIQRPFRCEGSQFCEAQCKIGQDALSGHCTASIDGVAIPILSISHRPRIGRFSRDPGGTYACETDQPATIDVGVTCASRFSPQ